MNLPEDRMLLIGDNLINVDDISTVSAKHQEAAPMLRVSESKWMEITTLSGKKICVDTDMTIREFEIERAKKFTPVVESSRTGPVQEIVVTHSEDGWVIEGVKTVWEYYDEESDEWYRAQDLGNCIKQAEWHNGLYRAVMERTISKEWNLNE
jgi:hypothetical protein